MSVHIIHQSRPDIPRDRLIRLPDVESATGCKKSTIYLMIEEGRFPKPVRFSGRHVAWPESAVLQWIQDSINAPPTPPTPRKSSLKSRLQQVLSVHGDAEEIAAGLERQGNEQDYFVKEAVAHIRSLDLALRELLSPQEGGAA